MIDSSDVVKSGASSEPALLVNSQAMPHRNEMQRSSLGEQLDKKYRHFYSQSKESEADNESVRISRNIYRKQETGTAVVPETRDASASEDLCILIGP